MHAPCPSSRQDPKREGLKLRGVVLHHTDLHRIALSPHPRLYTCPVDLPPPQDPKRERIKLLGRRGFARIALEEQVDGIVCVYYFGQSQVRQRRLRTRLNSTSCQSETHQHTRMRGDFGTGVCATPAL